MQQGGAKPNKVQAKLNDARIQRTLTVGGGYFEDNLDFDEENEEGQEPESKRCALPPFVGADKRRHG